MAKQRANTAQLPENGTWTNLPLVGGWVQYVSPYGTAQYMKDAIGVVHLRGLISSGTTTAGTIMFTLPAGFRPGRHEIFACRKSGNTGLVWELRINTNGIASIGDTEASAGWSSVAGVTFVAEN